MDRKKVANLVFRFVLLVCSFGFLQNVPPPEQMLVGQRYGNEILVPTNQLLNPTGKRIEFAGRPVDIALSPTQDLVALRLENSIHFRRLTGEFMRSIASEASSYTGLAFSPDGNTLAVSQLGSPHSVLMLKVPDGSPVSNFPLPEGSVPAGLVFDASGNNLYVALNRENCVAKIDTVSGRLLGKVNVGVAPLALALNPASTRLFVTNWGGEPESEGSTAMSSGTKVAVDARGVASSGTVSVIDVPTFSRMADITVGLHPGGIQVSPDGSTAAVANANSDTVSFIDTKRLQVVSTVRLPSFSGELLGSSPTSLAFSPGNDWLYVTCSGINSIALLRRIPVASIAGRSDTPAGQTRFERGSPIDDPVLDYRLVGYAPVDWYPVALVVARGISGGESVIVANTKGIGSRNATERYYGSAYLGTITILRGLYSDAQLSRDAFQSNNPFQNASQSSDSPSDLSQLGIKHVFFVIKENKTYDQVFGDLGRGNGDPALTMFGEDTTPNQHLIAREFVTFDNFYASGVRSADGHQWLTQAMATDYLERAFPSFPRSYPYSGEDPLAFASSGFIWNNVQAGGLSVRIFGEFTLAMSGHDKSWNDYYEDSQRSSTSLRVVSSSSIASLNDVVEPSYPSFAMNIPDLFRTSVFLEKFRQFERDGTLPNLVIIQLPSNHTAGTSPGFPTPAAMVADNDLAFAKIVEAVSRSRYWPTSVIFGVEDDTQTGVDHVDGHRTVCLVAGPHVKRGVVDPTHYNQTSLVRTIEEILGLPPMNRFDASAMPMRFAFTSKPDYGVFSAVPSRVPIQQANPSMDQLRGEAKHAALDSSEMDFSKPDAAPEDRLNRILWHTAKGWNRPYPPILHSKDCPGADPDD